MTSIAWLAGCGQAISILTSDSPCSIPGHRTGTAKELITAAAGTAGMTSLFTAAESVTKWAAGLNDKVSIWTVVWACPDKQEHSLNPTESDQACSVPLIWVRHDRSATLPAGCIRVNVNGVETKVNDGLQAELTEGMEEVIQFEAFGEAGILVVQVEKTPWLQMQVQPNFTYSMQLGGRILKPDRPEAVAAAQREARGSRCRVREWRLVSQRSDEWTGEMVVEYAVRPNRLLPDPSAVPLGSPPCLCSSGLCRTPQLFWAWRHFGAERLRPLLCLIAAGQC